MADDMQQDNGKTTARIVPLPGDGQVNLDTYREHGLSFPDFPGIRKSIRKYAEIVVASPLILERKANGAARTVMAVRDTKELLVDGRPALNVAYSTEVNMPLKGGTSTYTETTLIPIETVAELVSRIEAGDIPFTIHTKEIEFDV